MKKSELKQLIREVVEEAARSTFGVAPYVYVDKDKKILELDGNFVLEYIEGVEDGTFTGAVYKKITK